MNPTTRSATPLNIQTEAESLRVTPNMSGNIALELTHEITAPMMLETIQPRTGRFDLSTSGGLLIFWDIKVGTSVA